MGRGEDEDGGGEGERYRLPARASRGGRMQQAMEEALEEDEADADFWGQEFWAEAEDDEEFGSDEAEGEGAEDEFDSDFNDSEESESEGDEDGRVRREERAEASAARKRASTYRDPAAKRARSARTVGARAGAGVEEEPEEMATPKSPRHSRARGGTSHAGAEEGRGREAAEGGMRKSKRELAVKAGVQLDASLAAQRDEEARKKRERESAPAKVPYKRFTQAELLEEAKQTAVANTASLHRLQLREEEVKQRARMEKMGKGMAGMPWVRSSSRKDVHGGATVLTFYNVDDLPKEIKARAPPDPPEPLRCAVTGKPAKYRDPLTGQGYCDVAAFKVLRTRASLRQH